MFKILRLSNQQLFDHPDLAQWAENYKRIVPSNALVLLLFALIFLPIYMIGMEFSRQFDGFEVSPAVWFTPVLMSFWVAFKLIGENGPLGRIHRMTALSKMSTLNCQSALELANKYPGCKKHVDKVLEQGREILLLDLWHLKNLQSMADAETLKQKKNQAKQRFGAQLTENQKAEKNLMKAALIPSIIAVLSIIPLIKWRGAIFNMVSFDTWGYEYSFAAIALIVVVYLFAIGYMSIKIETLVRHRCVWTSIEAINVLDEVMKIAPGREYIEALQKQGRAILINDVIHANILNIPPTVDHCRELHGIQA